MLPALQPIGIVRPGVAVNITLAVYLEDEKPICLLHTLRGKVKLKPKAWLQAVRGEMVRLEHIAREAGCHEMRIEGRDWSRVLQGMGYMPWGSGEGHALRKVL